MCIGAASALHQIGPLKADCLPRTRHEDLSRSESRAHVLRESPVALLPIIIVGQNVQAAAARAEATYNDAATVLEEAKQIQAHLAAEDAEIEKILTALTSPRAV